MRAIDRIIDCFMHGLIHLGSSLLNMHYSQLTNNRQRLQYHPRNECQQEYNSGLRAPSKPQTLSVKLVNKLWQSGKSNKNAWFDLSVKDTGPVKFIHLLLTLFPSPSLIVTSLISNTYTSKYFLLVVLSTL